MNVGDQAIPLAPGPEHASMAETARLLNTSPTSIKRLMNGHLLEAKYVAFGAGRPRLYFERDKVLDLAKTWRPSAAHIRNTKGIDRRAAGLSQAVARADGRVPAPKVKPKAKAKRKPKPKLSAPLTRVAPAVAPAPAPDEGKRLIIALATLQDLYGKESKPDGEIWAQLRAWAER